MAGGDHQRATARILCDAPRALVSPIVFRFHLLCYNTHTMEGIAQGASREQHGVWHIHAIVHAEDQGIGGSCALEGSVALVDKPAHVFEGSRREGSVGSSTCANMLQRPCLLLLRLTAPAKRRRFMLLQASAQLLDLSARGVDLLPLLRLAALLVS